MGKNKNSKIYFITPPFLYALLDTSIILLLISEIVKVVVVLGAIVLGTENRMRNTKKETFGKSK